MAATVVGYMLGDARLIQPVLQRSLGEAVVEADENLVGRLTVLIAVIEAYQLQGLIADGVVHQLLRLLHTERDVHAAVTVGLDLIPGQLFDVTLAKPCQTRKEEGFLQYLRGAGRIGEVDKLLT